ncbi:TadE/TadG family type IV pilus assembly protein [Methylopila sp. M107]|uniref:TadE/TadG family type IV pilus assembly protein n=1 Tax=Methylopila sp. M107 TaxID=1101190 RepID=UPI00036836A4|nr:TadE/TadG family type IV pilus assembly protein [Methylopila sp. M107]
MIFRRLPLLADAVGTTRRLARDRRGASAVEFALLTPVFGLILAGTLDMGSSLYAQFGLNSAVSAGANYALANASGASSSGSATLSDAISKLASGAQGLTVVTGVATVNAGTTSTTLNSATSRAGTASAADSCYCPSVSGATVTWGSVMTCNAACPSGGYAGKFVVVSAARQFTSFLGSYSFAPTGRIFAQTMVQVQ